jgi:hypothetical protein
MVVQSALSVFSLLRSRFVLPMQLVGNVIAQLRHLQSAVYFHVCEHSGAVILK